MKFDFIFKHPSEAKKYTLFKAINGTPCIEGGNNMKVPYRKTLNAKQVRLLIRLSAQLDGDDLATISSIIFQLAP